MAWQDGRPAPWDSQWEPAGGGAKRAEFFINERVCVRGAETLMGVPQPWSSSIGGVGIPGLNPKAWRVWGVSWGSLTEEWGPSLCPRC